MVPKSYKITKLTHMRTTSMYVYSTNTCIHSNLKFNKINK